MRRIVLLFLASFITCFAFSQSNQAVLDYIEKYKGIAMEEMQRTGVPAAITLAQGIHESQAGQSTLAIETNNHFGIKCKAEWTGSVFYYDDDAKDECFRSYPCVDDSYRDHSDFLATRPNYKSLFALDPLDYKAWSFGLKRAGYATSPSYAYKLIKTIEDYNLQQYSELALNGPMQKEEGNVLSGDNSSSEEPVIEDKKDDMTLEPVVTTEQVPATDNIVTEKESTPVIDYPEGIFQINNTNVIYAQAGVSLFAIAANNNISYSKLLEFNELKNEDILKTSMLVYLERKPKRSSTKPYHITSSNETLRDIAQTEGVQLQSILEYNNLNAFYKPGEGSRIYLQDQGTGKTARKALK